MAGRHPRPFTIVNANNNKLHHTQAELDARKRNEPKIDSVQLKCPRHLTPEAKKEWRRIVKLYGELKEPIITDLDVNALEIYCEALVTYRKAMRKVRETSEVYRAKSDPEKPRKNPWLLVANDASVQIKRYGEILLLDPVSRARVGLAKAKEEDLSPMAAFLKKRNDGYGS